MKIRPVGAQSFHAERPMTYVQTWRRANCRFSQFCVTRLKIHHSYSLPL